jgi:hypothetical protein
MNQKSPSSQVVAVLVADDKRIDMLPSVFGTAHMMRAETLVNHWLRRLAESYTGGDWAYYTTTNDAFYMAPLGASTYELGLRGASSELSADAAGIAASLFAWGQLCNETELDDHILVYYALRDFAKEHAEGELILSLID